MVSKVVVPPFTLKCARCRCLFKSVDGTVCDRCKDYMTDWRAANKDKKRIHDRTYEAKHRERVNARFRARSKSEHGRALRKAALRRWKVKIRTEMVAAYGGCCECCGETELRFLTLEHKNGGGSKHRKELGGQGAVMVQLRRLGWPKTDYTVLCFNCNLVTKDGLPCPHKLQLPLSA